MIVKICVGTCGLLSITEQIITLLETYPSLEVIDLNEGKTFNICDLSLQAAQLVQDKKVDRAIIVDLWGQCSFMIASKLPNVIAAPVYDTYSTEFAARHNDANVLCLAGRFLGIDMILGFVKTYFQYHFDGGRHKQRVKMLKEIIG